MGAGERDPQPSAAAMGLSGRGQAAWQGTAAGMEAGKRGLENLIREQPLAEGRWDKPRSALWAPLQEGRVFS